MLKISTIDTQSERRLVLEGKLIEPWVAELEKAWEAANFKLDDRQLVIDLSETIVISVEGKKALLELMQRGAKFACCGVLTRYLVDQLAEACSGQSRRRKTPTAREL